MKIKHALVFGAALLALSLFNLQFSIAFAQDTPFTYQGRLNDNGAPANGRYDITFTLFAANTNGVAIAGPVTNSAVGVTNGLFTAAVDFGSVLTGGSNWLEIAVSTNGAKAFSTLSPRQQLTPVPYAITAENVIGGGLAAGAYGNAVTLNNAANQFTGSFTGNGADVTNVNAGSLGGLTSSNFWQLGGNSITPGQFLGTLNWPLELWSYGTPVLRLYGGGFAPVIVAGSQNNAVNGSQGSTIAGGGNDSGLGPNTISSSDYATIGGGYGNRIQTGSDDSTIDGGHHNTITNALSSNISGGFENIVLSQHLDSIGGGFGNQIGASNALINTSYGIDELNVIAGGSGNFIAQNRGNGAIGGGYNNTISNFAALPLAATIPGGGRNTASGSYAFAAGYRAKAMHNGTLVWADSTDADFASTGANQFLIRAGGGVGIGTTAPEAQLHVADGSAGTVTANANSIAVFERSGTGYVSLLAPAANETGILFGNPNSAQDGGIVFNNSLARSGLEFRTGTNATQMTILANGNVGIGTTSPSRELEVQNSGDTEIGLKSTDAVGHLWTIQSSGLNNNSRDGSFQLIDRTLNVAREYVLTNGNVGLGRLPAANELEIEGYASKTTAGSWLANSDARIKTGVHTISHALEKLEQVRLVEFHYTDEYRAKHPKIEDRPYVNVIAQEFQQVFPDAVKQSGETLPDGQPILQVDTYPLTIYSASAIQEVNCKLDSEISDLRTELKRRDAENAELKRRLDTLERIILNQKSN